MLKGSTRILVSECDYVEDCDVSRHEYDIIESRDVSNDVTN